MITNLPRPIFAQTQVRPATLRKFAPNYKGFCSDCGWASYEYCAKDEAEFHTDRHSEECSARLTADLAAAVPVEQMAAKDVRFGHHILLRDLRTLEVAHVVEDGNDAHIIYLTPETAEVITLPADYPVKVVV